MSSEPHGRAGFEIVRWPAAVIRLDGRHAESTIGDVLATCPFCGHALLLVEMYRRGARRACDRCAAFSEFDGHRLVAPQYAHSVLRPPAKTAAVEPEAGSPAERRAVS